MKELEIQLRCWALRHPSAKLKQRILESATSAPVETVQSFRFAWIAPAVTALFLVLVTFNQRQDPALSGSSHSTTVVAMIMSNQTAPAYLPGSFKSTHNSVSAETFEWTNGSHSTSSIGSLSHPKGSH